MELHEVGAGSGLGDLYVGVGLGQAGQVQPTGLIRAALSLVQGACVPPHRVHTGDLLLA